MEPNKKLIIFTDIGDTVIDETTEVRYKRGIVDHADCIPGAKETLLRLYEAGFTIVMVADGLVESFHNTMTQHNLEHVFTAKIISENVGYMKPSAAMFQAAMDALHLTEADKGRIIMVGNNQDRDTIGANRFDITSVQIEWSKQYLYWSINKAKEPVYRVKKPEELWDLALQLEEKLENGESLKTNKA